MVSLIGKKLAVVQINTEVIVSKQIQIIATLMVMVGGIALIKYLQTNMDLKISYNWLREYVDTKLSPADLARELSLHGPSIERIHPQQLTFSKVVVGELLSVDPHPNADKLRLTTVNTGSEKLQIVCGAPNIMVGQKVPAVLVGGTVGEMEIKQTAIRGIESHGMLCSARELGLSDDHSGIYILPSKTKVGTPLESLLKTEDTILDVEVTGNRTDLMSVVGLAREASAIIGGKYTINQPHFKTSNKSELALKATVTNKKTCRRYQSVAMSGITVEASPLWLQQRLISAGMRPINNIVDITNYILLEYGQPLHAFDYEKISKQQIIVRNAKTGDKFRALDGKDYELNDSMLVIADGEKPLAIAGIMGGEESATTEDTTSIVIESANFDPLAIRKTARTLNLFSDSSALFEKNIHPQSTESAINRAIELIIDIAGGHIASEISDYQSVTYKQRSIKLFTDHVSKLVGETITTKQITAILKRLGFGVSGDSDQLTVEIPWWRDTDIIAEHDLIEEVARMYGYHHIKPQLPPQRSSIATVDSKFIQEALLKQQLASMGYVEIYSYSLVSAKTIISAGLSPDDHLATANPLSQDYQYLRTSLVPSLLEVVDANQNIDRDLHLFEISNVYIPREKDLPQEELHLAITRIGQDTQELYREVRGVVEALAQTLHISNLTITATTDTVEPYWQAGEVARIMIGEEVVGTIGVIKQATAKNFGVKQVVVAADLRVAHLISHSDSNPRYEPIAKYPAIELDLSIELDQSISYAQIVEKITDSDPLIKNIAFLSVYAGEKVASGKKALALRIQYQDDERTLTLEEVQTAHKKVEQILQQEYTVSIR
jgi:phenylalanyl-tRNA synthetase beta chain